MDVRHDDELPLYEDMDDERRRTCGQNLAAYVTEKAKKLWAMPDIEAKVTALDKYGDTIQVVLSRSKVLAQMACDVLSVRMSKRLLEDIFPSTICALINTMGVVFYTEKSDEKSARTVNMQYPYPGELPEHMIHANNRKCFSSYHNLLREREGMYTLNFTGHKTTSTGYISDGKGGLQVKYEVVRQENLTDTTVALMTTIMDRVFLAAPITKVGVRFSWTVRGIVNTKVIPVSNLCAFE